MNANARNNAATLRALTDGERIWQISRYAVTKRRTHVGVSLAVVAIAGVWLFRYHSSGASAAASAAAVPSEGMSLWDLVQLLLGLATLAVAICVWVGEVSQDWQRERPKLLSMFCFYEGRPVLICYHAYLADQGDIRAWSQQVCGRQMGAGDLSFVPVVDVRPPELLTDGRSVYLHHQVRFTLTEAPEVFASVAGADALPCLVWYPRERPCRPALVDAIPAAEASSLPGVSGWRG
jgi:hypothetical protein